MPRSYPAERRSCRPFIVTPYFADPNGRLIAQLPSCCPASCGSGEAACQLKVGYHRFRKTGPAHPLAVARCCTHGLTFTLYPPGYAPYRRQPMLKVAPDGQPIHGQQEDDQERADLEGTIFEAAADAKRGRSWARTSSEQPPDRWWSTQGRHLALAARLVGVAGNLSERVRSTIAAVLSVDALLMRDGARAVGYRAIGGAVCGVLARLTRAARRSRQLLLCGHLAGRWGEPLHWDVERQVLQRSPFRPAGTAGPG